MNKQNLLCVFLVLLSLLFIVDCVKAQGVYPPNHTPYPVVISTPNPNVQYGITGSPYTEQSQYNSYYANAVYATGISGSNLYFAVCYGYGITNYSQVGFPINSYAVNIGSNNYPYYVECR